MPGTHCNLLYHLVFSTKERRPLISAAMKSRLHDDIGGIDRKRRAGAGCGCDRLRHPNPDAIAVFGIVG
jgi:hypothetical protein